MCHNSKSENGRYGSLYAVKGVEVYKNDVVVKWARRSKKREPEATRRGEVLEFSDSSRKRLAFVASNTDVEFTVMMTLTYPREYPSDGKTVKGHLNRMLSWLRSVGMVDYLWFMEFQRRGAPHFHILTNINVDYRDVARRWYDAVGSGDERHLKAGTRVETVRKKDGARRYVVKYGMKMDQKVVPSEYANAGRFWGCSKSVKPRPVATSSATMRQDELIGLVDGWEYKNRLKSAPLGVLYNASQVVLERIKDEREQESEQVE